MSHMSLVKLGIVNPNLDLLRLTIEAIAKQFGAKTTTRIRAGYGDTRTVDLGFKGGKFPDGVGVEVGSNGEVTLIGDFYRAKAKSVELHHAITQQYAANALSVALKEDGWQVTQQRDKEHILIRAEAF